MDEHARWCARLEWLLIVLAAVWLAFAVYPEAQLDNDMSRFASVERLVEAGTWVIDDSPFHYKKPRGKRPATPIVDRAKMGDHFYSTKPPMMSFLMAGEYWVWRHVFGLSFANETQHRFLIWVLTYTFVALPFLSIGLVYRWAGGWFISDPFVRLVGMFVLLFCNQLWGFSRTLNNHVPSAAMLFFSMIAAIGLVHGKVAPKAWLFALIGFAAGMLPTFDLPGMFFCIPLFLYLLWFFPKPTLTWFVIGAIIPLGLHFALTYWITGGLIPVYMQKELYHYEDSYWDRMGGIDALQEPKWLYFFHLSVGRKGLFSLYPILVLSVLAVLGSFRQPASETQTKAPRVEGLALVALTLLWMLFYTIKTNNYGGVSFGYRWFMFFTPALAFYSLFAIERMKQGWGWAVVCLLIAISFYSGWQCSVDPWTVNEEWTCRFLGKWEFK
ncbi:MAG: hypothetical protein GHCLOJNM_02926 [bacterium]|nr:hypothetical protein [bacterium]